MKKSILLLLILASCHKKTSDSHLISLQMIDRNGQTETISQESRIKMLEKQDFNRPQPYEKILRVYSKNEEGKNPSILTTYHKNGQLFQKLEALDGRAFGKYEEFYENGIIHIQAKVIEGTADLNSLALSSWVFDGPCSIYYPNGALEAEFFYDRGKRSQMATYYFENGQVSKTIFFADDLAHGLIKEYYPTGQLYLVYDFDKGQQHGQSIKFSLEQKTLFEETWEHDCLLTGSYYDSDEKPISKIENGFGIKSITENNCLILEMEYKHGKQDGKITYFDHEGLITHSFHISNQQKNGEEVVFFEGTQIPKMRLQWFEDSISGLVKTFYKDGQLESQKNYHLNKKNGPTSVFYPSGELMMLETYSQDKLVEGKYYKKGDKTPYSTVEDGSGKATFFDEWGAIKQEINYDKSKIILPDD